MTAALAHRYGHAKPTSVPGVPDHYEACDVLAGAYNRGLGPREDQETLCHTAVCDAQENILHTLCRKVAVEHLITDAGSTMRDPTCPVCAQRLATLREKGKARQFKDAGPVAGRGG